MNSASPPPTALQRYLAYRRAYEIGFWVVFMLLQAIGNSITVRIDVGRSHLAIAAWKPVVWEFSSNLVLLALIPLVLIAERRVPLRWEDWRRALSWHLPISVAYSALHVLGMVGLRTLAYAAAGETYHFGSWLQSGTYEYLKDVRSYAVTLGVITLYRQLLLRVQGEASLLAAPEEGPPLEPLDRPERFLVRKLGKEFLIAARDIEWLEAAGNYVNLHLRGHVYPLRSTMAGIESRVDPARFRRVHRSYIVNLDHLVQIEPLESGDAQLLLRDGARIPCSRRYRAALRPGAGAEAR